MKVDICFRSWSQSRGGLGLQKAREKSRKKKLRKAAKSKDAYTVKIKPGHLDLSLKPTKDPQELCRYVNQRAAQGHPMRDYNKYGWIVGRIIRAFVTDIGEVWARVIPVEPIKPKELKDIW